MTDRPAAPSTADWPIFRGDAGLTGRSAVSLPERLVFAFTLKVGDEVAASPVIAGNVLYAASTDGKIAAFDLARRLKLWEFVAPDGFEAAPLFVAGEKLVIAGCLDGSLYALAADTGRLAWRAETGAKIVGSANLAPQADGRGLALVGSYDRSLYAVDARTGKIRWTVSTANYVNGTPALADGRAVFGGCDARIHIIDLAAGRETGAVDTGAYIAGSAAAENGVAYVGNYAGRLLAIEAATGRILWSFALPDANEGFAASPAVADDSIVVGGKDAFLYCLNRADGKLRWKFHGRSGYLSSALIGGGRVFAASSDGELVLLDLASGRLLTTADLGAAVTASPAFAAGYLAVAALDGNVYLYKGE